MSISSSEKIATLVWNLHTRIFHWSFATLTIAALALGIIGDNELMVWHYRCGYALLGLIGFRLICGLFSSDYANFRQFPLNPSRIKHYLQGKLFPGHNPLGVWMIVALLLVVTIQAGSGLLTSDGFWLEGPWVIAASDDTVSLASTIHGYGEYLLLTLIGLHLLGNTVNAVWKKQGLIRAMFNGKKQLPAEENIPAAKPTSWRVIVGGWIVAGLIIWLATNP